MMTPRAFWDNLIININAYIDSKKKMLRLTILFTKLIRITLFQHLLIINKSTLTYLLNKKYINYLIKMTITKF